MIEILKSAFVILFWIGIGIVVGHDIFCICRNLYLLNRIDKLSYYRKNLDDEKSFIKACEMIYGKLQHTLPHSIVLLELVQCKEDTTQWIYDMSKYDDKKVISVQITHPFSDAIMEHPLQIMSNQTIYMFKNGAIVWRDT